MREGARRVRESVRRVREGACRVREGVRRARESMGRMREARRGRVGVAVPIALCLGIAACSGAMTRHPEAGPPPAVVTERSRDVAQTNDFLRLVFLAPPLKPTRLGGPNAKRVFVGASAFYQPALPLTEIVRFPGLSYDDQKDLFAMRCRPRDRAIVEPALATWPNVMHIVATDPDLAGQSCSDLPVPSCPGPRDAERSVYCLAREFEEKFGAFKSAFAVQSLKEPIAYGARLVSCCGDAAHPGTCADVLSRRYGIFPGFSGLGLAVKDSGDNHEATAAEVLGHAVTPEYLVQNVTLAEADCACIRVPPYPGRGDKLLDLDVIAERGGTGGNCNTVDRLEPARR